MSKNKISCLMATSLLSTLTICATYEAEQVYAEEGKPDLTIETKEIDISEIPEDRYIQLGVRIDNNPGMYSLTYSITFDTRLYTELLTFTPEACSDADGWSGNLYGEDHSKALIDVNFDMYDPYFKNEEYLILGFYLPEDVRPGDWYQIGFIEGEGRNICRYYTDNGYQTGFASFGAMNSGGIRIKGTPQEPENDSEPEPQQQQEEPQYQEQNTPPAPSEQPEQTAPPVTSAASAITSSGTVTSLTTTSAVTEITTSAVISATSSETTATSPASASETSLTPASSVDHDEEHNNSNNKEKMIIPAVCAGLVAAIILFFYLKRRKSNG